MTDIITCVKSHPQTIEVLRNAATAPDGAVDDPPATMQTYAAALADVLAGFETPGARDDLPRPFVEMTRKGMDAGLGDTALTAVIDVVSGDGGAACSAKN